MDKVFLSHSSVDKPIVRKIKRALNPFTPNLWIDELEILPGDSLIGRLSDGIMESNRVLVFISENSVNSKWVKEKVQSFISREISEDTIRVIPILIDSTPLPPFLNHKFYIRFSNEAFSEGIVNILKGIFRRQSIITVAPLFDTPYELMPFFEEIEQYKKNALAGDLIIVYDLYEFVDAVSSSLIPDRLLESDRLKVALPKCLDFLSKITPSLLKTLLSYSGNDAGATPEAEKLIKIVWRLVFLAFSDYMKGMVSLTDLENQKKVNFHSAIEEVKRLHSKSTEHIPSNYGLGMLTLAWLEYLDIHLHDTYDIGFAGTTTKDGINILDANHVRIPKGYIREDSLKVYRGTTPDGEFIPVIWKRYILPYIVADAIVQYSFMGLDPEEVIPRIGLKKV